MKTIIFDLDGTLINTLTDINNALNTGLNSIGVPPQSEESLRKIIGHGIFKTARKSINFEISDEQLKNIYEIFVNHYDKHYMDNSLPYNGILDLLVNLKKKYRLAVVTNKVQEYAENLVNKYFNGIFDYICGAKNDKPRKPDPYLVDLTLNYLETSKEDALYIGDTEVDYQTAKNSSIRSINVTYGYRTKEELLAFDEKMEIAESFEELNKKIEQILN